MRNIKGVTVLAICLIAITLSFSCTKKGRAKRNIADTWNVSEILVITTNNTTDTTIVRDKESSNQIVFDKNGTGTATLNGPNASEWPTTFEWRNSDSKLTIITDLGQWIHWDMEWRNKDLVITRSRNATINGSAYEIFTSIEMIE